MGRYYNKLNKIFIILAVIIVSIPMFIVSITSFVYQKELYSRELQKSMTTRTNLAQMSLTTVTSMLGNLMNNSAIESWQQAKNSADYYYYSVQAYQQIKKTTSDLSLVECDISVTINDKDSFVISGRGTNTKDYFFKNETSLSGEQVSYIFEYFQRNKGSLVLPVYYENKLNELYYIVKRVSSQNDLLYIVRLPYEVLFGEKYDQHFLLFNENQILAYSSNIDKDKDLFDRIYKSYREQNVSIGNDVSLEYQDKILTTGYFPNIDWSILYINNGFGINTSQVIFYVLFFIMLLLLALLLSHYITDRLYQPIKSVISEIAVEPSDKMLDEFSLLKQNTNKIKVLSEELQNALNQNEVLATQRYYRDLLFGANTDPEIYNSFKIDEGNFCVAIIEFQIREGEQTENEIFLLKNNIHAFTQENQNLYYSSISYYSCAVIIKADNLNDAKKSILEIINPLNEDIELKASISDIRFGTENIKNGYREALQILEYKYLYDRNKILTMEQISDLDLTTFYYPLITENRLIQSVINGKEDGIDIFNELISENIKRRNLTPDTLKNFIYALIGTLSRIFQELKTTPEQLLGDKTQFNELYSMWNSSTIVSQLQNIITSITEAVNSKNNIAGDELLSDMLEYIHKNYSDDIMLIDLANEFNISIKYCSALFKKLKDDNFKNYLNKYRVEKAEEFIKNDPDIKINDLSKMTGFNSANSFIRVFSKYTGMTPKAYAEKVMKK